MMTCWAGLCEALTSSVTLIFMMPLQRLLSHVFVHAKSFSCVQFFATLWTGACQAPSSMGFSRQEWEWELPWSGMSCPPPGTLSDPGIESTSRTSPALADRFFTVSTTWEVQTMFYYKATRGWISCPSYELLRCGQEIQWDTNLWVLHQTFQSQG